MTSSSSSDPRKNLRSVLMPGIEGSRRIDAATGSVEDAGQPSVDSSALRARSRSHRFGDRRQERIYQQLVLIGPGPAGFFRDACFLVEHPDLLVMSAHMIGHALREMESAVRQVLCAMYGVQEPNGDGKHVREIS